MRLCVILKRGHGKYREKYSTRSITDNEKNSRVCRVLVKSSGRIPRLHVNMAELLRGRKFTVHFFFSPPLLFQLIFRFEREQNSLSIMLEKCTT